MLHGLNRGIQQPSKFFFFSYLFPYSLLPPIYTNEWRDNGGNVTFNRLRPRQNLSVLMAIRKRIKIFFTQVSLLGFSFTCQHNYLTFSFKNVNLWWFKFPPTIRIKTPLNIKPLFHLVPQEEESVKNDTHSNGPQVFSIRGLILLNQHSSSISFQVNFVYIIGPMRFRKNTQKLGWGRYQDFFIRSITN